jgi:hypothetical protein
MVLCATLLGIVARCDAASEPPFVSHTFAEIQSRVLRRDVRSGAILEVRGKDDAPRPTVRLNFSIEEASGAEAVVMLSYG